MAIIEVVKRSQKRETYAHGVGLRAGIFVSTRNAFDYNSTDGQLLCLVATAHVGGDLR